MEQKRVEVRTLTGHDPNRVHVGASNLFVLFKFVSLYPVGIASVSTTTCTPELWKLRSRKRKPLILRRFVVDIICFVLLNDPKQAEEEEDRKGLYSGTKTEFYPDVKPQWALKGESKEWKDGTIKVHTLFPHYLIVGIDKQT